MLLVVNAPTCAVKSAVMQDQPATLIRPPVCPDYRIPTGYATSELDKSLPVRHVMLVCDCGRTSDEVTVAEI